MGERPVGLEHSDPMLWGREMLNRRGTKGRCVGPAGGRSKKKLAPSPL